VLSSNSTGLTRRSHARIDRAAERLDTSHGHSRSPAGRTWNRAVRLDHSAGKTGNSFEGTWSLTDWSGSSAEEAESSADSTGSLSEWSGHAAELDGNCAELADRGEERTDCSAAARGGDGERAGTIAGLAHVTAAGRGERARPRWMRVRGEPGGARRSGQRVDVAPTARAGAGESEECFANRGPSDSGRARSRSHDVLIDAGSAGAEKA
jgi:hypothetical protein